MSKAQDAEKQRRRKSKAIEMIAEMADSGFARNPNRPKAANIEPQFAGGLLGYFAEDPVAAAKGTAVMPFTVSPDLLGVLASISNYGATRAADRLTGAQPGTFSGFKPFGEISGNPIREAIGLDPSSGQGMVAEALTPIGTIGKGAAYAMSKLLPLLTDGKALMAAAPIIGKAPRYRGDPAQSLFEGPAFRYEPGFEGGAPRGATAQDVINEEMERKGASTLDEFGIDEDTYDALKNEPASSLLWVGRDRDELFQAYGPTDNWAGFIEDPEDISDVTDLVQGSRVVYEDPDGVLLWVKPEKGRKPTEVGAMLADAPLKAVESTIDAERRFSDGETIFAVHEMDEQPSLVESLDQLKSYSYDQLYTAGKPKPLTRKEFYDSFDMHTDLRGREGGADQNYESIMEGGFRQGTFNRLPAAMAEGGPGMGGQYAPKPGDYVYLIPSSVEGKSAGGRPSMPQGWRPGGDDGGIMVQIREGEDLYDAYARTIKGTGPTKVGAMLADAPLPASPGVGAEISTRVPTAVKAAEDPRTTYLRPDRASAAAHPQNYENMLDLFRGNDNLPQNLDRASPEEIDDYLQSHMKDNLLFLFDEMPKEIRDRAAQWYVGANKWANELSNRYGITPDQSAAVLAALSPQKDWFQNASLAERVLDTPQNLIATPEMISKAGQIYAKPHLASLFDRIKNTPIDQLDDYEAAMLVRLYDETYNDRAFRVLSPEGDFQDFVKTGKGENRAVAWGSMGEISKAVSAMRNGDPANIFDLLGQQHKVRSFYNNIRHPFSQLGDVTSDTHQVAANLLRPLSGSSPEVLQNLGAGAESAYTGIKGTYPIHADAVRGAAEVTGNLPREMQSITWEAVRGLFTPEMKRNDAFTSGVKRIWGNYRTGRITADEAREQIVVLAGGIKTPEWARSRAGGNAAASNTSYERGLPGRPVSTRRP